MMDQFEEIADYPALSDAQRIQARNNARRNIVAKYARKPDRAEFNNVTPSRFPPLFTWAVGLALAFVALSAGIISAFRLYYAGSEAFYESVPNATLAAIVGVLTPLAAEVLVIVATVAAQAYLHSRGRAQVVALVPVALGTAVAFVGNWQIANPSDTWGWVETVFPPVAVLSVAFLFELSLVPELERRQSDDLAYRAALADYDLLVNRPEDHREWRNVYGAALWEMWMRVYERDAVGWIIGREIRQLIALREMSSDAFFSDEISAISRNRTESTGKNSVSQREVLAYLKENPDAVLLQQNEIAEITGASAATVSRAFRKFQKNGTGK